MYDDQLTKSLDGVKYLVNLASDNEDANDRLTTMKKAHQLLGTVIQNQEFALELKKVLK